MSEESESGFVAPDDEALVVGQVTSTAFINAKVLLESESIDLGNPSEDEICAYTKVTELDSDSQLLTAADQDPALRTLQSYEKTITEPLAIPVVNSFSTDPSKYDLDRLIDRNTQKHAESGHRFSATHLTPPARKQRNPNEPNFLQRNRLNAVHPQTRCSHSFDEAAKRPHNTEKAEDRLYHHRIGVEEKLKRLKKELSDKELEQCTFEPEILGKRKEEAPRTAAAYFQDQMQHQQLVSAKIQKLREQAEAAETPRSFTPTLCEKSIRLLAGRPQSTLPRYEELYQQHRKRLQSCIHTCESTASLDLTQLSSKSSVSPAPRNRPVEFYLMQDAARRQRAKSALPIPETPVSLVNPNSHALLIKRFKAEFQSVWSELDYEDQIHYSQLSQLLKTLKFIDNQSVAAGYQVERELLCAIWCILRLDGESRASKQNLETLLCAIMAFPQSETAPSPTELVEETTDTEFNSKRPVFGRVENGVFMLGPGDTRRIHRYYKTWYDHRTASAKSNLNPTYKSPVEYSFQPSLSKESLRLAEARLRSLTPEGHYQHDQILADEKSSRAQRREELAKTYGTKTLKECVFKPTTDKRSAEILEHAKPRKSECLAQDYFRLVRSKGPNTEKTAILFDLAPFASQRREKLAKTQAELDMERHALECKFAPETEVPLGTIQADLRTRPSPARGVDTTVERLLKARREFEAMQAKKERGEPCRAVTQKLVLSVLVRGKPRHFKLRTQDSFAERLHAFSEECKLTNEEVTALEAQVRAQYRAKVGRDL